MDYGSSKKLGVVSSYIARDFFTREIPSRIPTISEYCELFDVSRGVVQDALLELERSGSVQLHKRGSKGSFLVGRKPRQLYEQTLWDVLTGTMPAPLESTLQGLATGLCSTMTQCDMPFTFAFIVGARRRARALSGGRYDFSIVSALSARHYVQKWPGLRVAASLHPCAYAASPYYLLLRGAGRTGLEDGMRVLYDGNCYDQATLTRRVCEGKSVELVEAAFIGEREMFQSGEVDALVFRREAWVEKLENISLLPLPGQEGSTEPVLLANSSNFCMEKLLTQVFQPQKIAVLQQEVIEDPRKVRFF